jgi:hypothetical protein
MANCKSCGAELIWAESRSGKPMPFNAKPETRWQLVYNTKRGNC